MADVRIGSRPYFEHSVELVDDAPDVALLPDVAALVPSGQTRATELDDLLAARNLDSMLHAAIRLDPPDRALLVPRRFHAALDALMETFRQASEARLRSDPHGSALLAQAARVVAEEIELRDLLRMYRGALLQG